MITTAISREITSGYAGVLLGDLGGRAASEWDPNIHLPNGQNISFEKMMLDRIFWEIL